MYLWAPQSRLRLLNPETTPRPVSAVRTPHRSIPQRRCDAHVAVCVTYSHKNVTSTVFSFCVQGLRPFVRWPQLWRLLFLQQSHRHTLGVVGFNQSAVLILLWGWDIGMKVSLVDWFFFLFNTCDTFAGVEVWIENDKGECLRIRERRRVKVGHVAIGISDQVANS